MLYQLPMAIGEVLVCTIESEPVVNVYPSTFPDDLKSRRKVLFPLPTYSEAMTSSPEAVSELNQAETLNS